MRSPSVIHIRNAVYSSYKDIPSAHKGKVNRNPKFLHKALRHHCTKDDKMRLAYRH